jgi:hypothetical protein
MSNASVAITHYCERTGEEFWAEPINALTNLAFILAAIGIAYALRHSRPRSALKSVWDIWLLAGLMVAIGIGSFLWHTLATPWTEWADVIPILLFINVFLLSFLVRMARLRPSGILFWFILFQVFNFGLQSFFPPDFLNGSIFYLPTWASLLLMALYCKAIQWPGANRLLAATLVFTVSLTLRTIDQLICSAWPMGTHFGWHLQNGLTLYLLTRALMGAHPGIE